MIKKMFVEVQIDGKVVTLEMNIKGDAINAMHAYHNDEGEYSLFQPSYKVLWETEDGDRSDMSGQVGSLEAYQRLLLDTEFFKDRDFHMWSTRPYKKTWFEPGTPASEKYDIHPPFLLYGLGTVGPIISQEQADEIARNLEGIKPGEDWFIEDSEINQYGYVYALSDGTTLVVRGDGTHYFWTDDEGKVEEVEDNEE